MQPRCTICVFAKPPRPGEAKTRLAAQVGELRAAALAQAFLHDTWALVSSLAWAQTVIATTEGTQSDLDLPGRATLWFQGDGDLGQRIERIMRRALSEADLVIAIGADTPGLPWGLLAQARAQLAQADAVLGPCEDGGFYLLGLSRCPSGLLADLPWSASTTFAATRARLHERGMVVKTLDPWFDVDRPADLDRLRAALDRGALNAPATARVLTAFPRGEAPCG